MGSAATLSAESSRFFDCTLPFHIYASYELSLVEQKLGGYGIDLDGLQPLPSAGDARKTRS
jgi:hypothetical protein